MKDSGRKKQLIPKSGTVFQCQDKVNSQDDKLEVSDKAKKKKENKKKSYQERQK